MSLETPKIEATLEQGRKEALAREHLKEGVPHIVFSLIKLKEGGGGERWIQNVNNEQDKEEIRKIETGGQNVGEYSVDGPKFYLRLNALDKYSLHYRNCIGMVFVGTSKQSGKEISFITHMNATGFDSNDTYREQVEKFDEVLNQGIQKLQTSAEIGTIDAVIFGGADWDSSYKKIIDRYSKKITNVLGFDPVVLTGPGGYDSEDTKDKVHPSTDVYLDTQGRKIYILRRETPNEENDNPFFASRNINKEEK